MTYKAKVAVCSEIRTKHSTQSGHHLEFLNVKPGGTKETARIWKAIKNFLCDYNWHVKQLSPVGNAEAKLWQPQISGWS